MKKEQLLSLKEELARERKARIDSENLLLQKTRELEKASKKLSDTNELIEGILSGNNAVTDSLLLNIMDPFIVLNLKGKALWMNSSAERFFELRLDDEDFYPINLVQEDYLEYTQEAFSKLLDTGRFKDFKVKLLLCNGKKVSVLVNANIITNAQGEIIGAQGIIRDVTKEDEYKELILTQKTQLDIIVGRAPLGIVLTNNGQIIKANKTMSNLLGYSEEELQTMHVKDISAPESLQESKKVMGTLDSGKEEYISLIKSYIRKDGTRITGKCSISGQPKLNGVGVNQVAFIEDISKEIQAEERLRTSENRLTSLILNLQTGVLLIDSEGKILLTNAQYPRMFGLEYEPEHMVGNNIVEMCEAGKELFKYPEQFINRIYELLEKKEEVLGEIVEMAHGMILERDFIPIYTDGKYMGNLYSFTDITQKTLHKQELELQKEKYSGIISNMNLGLVECDVDDCILFVNNAYSQMSGLMEEELLGKDIKTYFDDLKPLKTLNGKDHAFMREAKFVVKGNDIRYWLLSSAPRYNNLGQEIGKIIIFSDNTQQKNLELQKEKLLTELEQSNEGLKEYAHIVSHDLKSPLRSISALASWISDDYKEVLDESGANNLQMMQEKIEGMDKLIDGILKYSTLEKDTLEEESVDFNEIIREIDEIIFKPENVSIVIKKKLPTLNADKTKIHQLFQNFMSNAVVNIDKEVGIVEIDYEEKRNHWQFSVSDNGVGIPKEYHEKIFKIFQSIGHNERSTGIGLSIVKKIVSLYGGKVWLESEIGKGTTFFFTLKK